MKKLVILAFAALALSSCLKDKPNVDFSGLKPFIELPYSGKAYFSSDAITDTGQVNAAGDRIITTKFSANVASVYAPSTATTVSVAVDTTLVSAYNAYDKTVAYEVMPSDLYTFTNVTVTIPGGQRLAYFTVTFDKSKFDPSKSYMLPIAIKSSNLAISGNFAVHYYHFIGNDFAGVYTYHYKRYQNGVGPTATAPNPDITDDGSRVISPITPTEFTMVTDYNGQGVYYDVTFTRTATASGVTYTNWSVQFTTDAIALWTAAGISNKVPPAFTKAPPATDKDPKFFELNYVSGGASGRYIDDTYEQP